MKVSQMQYERPDFDKFLEEGEALLKRFEEARSAEIQLQCLDELDRISEQMSTMASLAQIRFSLNNNDEFYFKEKEFIDGEFPKVSLFSQKFAKAILGSKHIDGLKEMLPKVVFDQLELQVKSVNEKILPLMVEESKLTTKYGQLMNNAVIEYNGEKYNIATIIKFFTNSDREVRRSATMAYSDAMMKVAPELDEIYDQLVKLRTRMGRELGFENYSALGYMRMGRTCYGKEDIAKFRENVKKYIVPVVSEKKEQIRAKFGWDKVHFYDNGVYTEHEPRPEGTPEEIFEKGSRMYHELAPVTGYLFDRMRNDEAFDVLARKGKWGGGYCTTIPGYKTPFILANFNGSSHDVEVLTHEFGHALAAEYGFKQGFNQQEATMETCEVHSMSMEFLTYPWMKDFFGDRLEDYKLTHIMGGLSFIPYGTIVDYFQQTVYDNPDMTPAERNAFWAKIEHEFLPHVEFDDIPFYKEGRRWQRQMHIYESPFYYIDYCLAQFTAFQILSLSLEDWDKAYERYMKFLKQVGSKSFTELLEYAGLKTPFEEKPFIEVCDAIKKLI